MCKNQERIIDQFAGYAPVYVCLWVYLLSFFALQHMNCVCVLEHICVPDSRLFAYFALIMFYGTIASLWMLLHCTEPIYEVFHSSEGAYLQTKQENTHTHIHAQREREQERGRKKVNTKRNGRKKIETKAVQVNKSEHKMNSNELRQYYSE